MQRPANLTNVERDELATLNRRFISSGLTPADNARRLSLGLQDTFSSAGREREKVFVDSIDL